MTISFNGSAISEVFYNGTDCTTVIFNGTTVFSAPRYLFSTGYNINGQLGLGDTTNRSSFTQIGSSGWSTGAGSNLHTLAIRSNGTLWAWGDNNFGALGVSGTKFSSPVQVGSLTNWSKVAAARYCSAAIKTDGTLWTWGSNNYGQCARSGFESSSPIQVGTLTNWAQVSLSYSFGAAVKTDGTLWTWGNNAYGQLGLGNRTNYSSPKQVGSLTNWASVSLANWATVAVKTDGTIWSWGFNPFGNLGLGNITSYSSPKQIGSLTTWSGLSERLTNGSSAVGTIKTNGTFWVWGRNDNYLLGLGSGNTNLAYSSPKQVGSLTDWSAVTFRATGDANGGAAHAIKTDNTLWGWGKGYRGAIGTGNRNNVYSPVQVATGNSWKKCFSGGNQSFAITT